MMSRISLRGQLLLSLCAVIVNCSHYHKEEFSLQTYKVRAELNNALDRYIADTQIQMNARKSLSAGYLEATDDPSCVHVL